jgi:hypothetical protein
MNALATRPWLWLLPLLFASACGSSSVKGDDGAIDSRAGGDGLRAVDRGATEAGSSSDAVVGVSMQVVYQGKSTTVALATLPPIVSGGVAYARLSDVVLAALPGMNLDPLLVDFEAGDGFHPAGSPNCTTIIPLPAAKLALGYVQVQSRNLAWDDSLAYPGCMGVKDAAKILLSDK